MAKRAGAASGVQTGPRGGKFYYTSTGEKIYGAPPTKGDYEIHHNGKVESVKAGSARHQQEMAGGAKVVVGKSPAPPPSPKKPSTPPPPPRRPPPPGGNMPKPKGPDTYAPPPGAAAAAKAKQAQKPVPPAKPSTPPPAAPVKTEERNIEAERELQRKMFEWNRKNSVLGTQTDGFITAKQREDFNAKQRVANAQFRKEYEERVARDKKGETLEESSKRLKAEYEANQKIIEKNKAARAAEQAKKQAAAEAKKQAPGEGAEKPSYTGSPKALAEKAKQAVKNMRDQANPPDNGGQTQPSKKAEAEAKSIADKLAPLPKKNRKSKELITHRPDTKAEKAKAQQRESGSQDAWKKAQKIEVSSEGDLRKPTHAENLVRAHAMKARQIERVQRVRRQMAQAAQRSHR